LSPDAFVFLGFLPEKKKKRRVLLGKVALLPWTLIFYVPPHDLQGTLEELFEALGDRKAALVREMSKLYQETLRGNISYLLEVARLESKRGELVLVVEGAKMAETAETWKEEALRLMSEKRSAKDVVSLVAERYGITKSAVKRWLRECADEEG
jgi:16S rRNA (cytidine1402-2'-O)-methyltransferase